MVPQRLSLVTLGVADVARAAEFYESLGWRRSSASQPSITFFKMQGSVLALFERGSLADDAAVSADGSGFGAVTLAINCESESEVDATYEAFLASGAEVRKRPERVDWGGYSGYVADPDGHLWEIAHNPFAPIDERGMLVI